VQITDAYGVPVEGAQATISVVPTGGLTFNSVPGEPACSPASSSSSITCSTDQFGFLWLDIVLGSTVSQPQINYTAAGGTASDFIMANIQAAPVISKGGVVDAASYSTTLVPGSFAAIFGSGLSDVQQDLFSFLCPAGASEQSCIFPLSFDDVSVSFDVTGATYPGFPYFVSPGQVNLVVPWELEGQPTAQVKLSIDHDLYSNLITVPIANYAPSFFQSCGAACAVDGATGTVITTSNPAKRGSYIQLYANGLGPVTNPPGDGVPAPLAGPLAHTTTTPIVTIGGAQAQVLFAGLAPNTTSEYQINVTVPATATTGGAVPISIQIGGATSPTSTAYGAVTIPVQ
jgi:uncharacterized protein (TIGR03437 family)